MNRVVLIGRLSRDVDTRTAGETQIAHFTVAVDRNVKKDPNSNQPTADFISCVAFGKTAEFIGKYFQKGSKIGLEGRIQTGSYEKDGQRVYTTDVIAERVEFCDSKNANQGGQNSQPSNSNDSWMNVPAGTEDEGLPFN